MSAATLTADIEQKVRDAFDIIHSLGVVHGDIRPDNILVGDDKCIWIIDFESSIFLDSIQPADDGEAMLQSDTEALTLCLKKIKQNYSHIDVEGIVGNVGTVNRNSVLVGCIA